MFQKLINTYQNKEKNIPVNEVNQENKEANEYWCDEE